MRLLAIGLAVAALGFPQRTPEHIRISKLLEDPPKATSMVIEYRPIQHLEDQSSWHIGDSRWWVRLQPVDIYPMAKLEKNKKYKVTGVVLNQGYGCVNVWVKKLEYSD